MTRPTTKDVDYALDWFAPSFGGPGGVLAAEVRALRDELAKARRNAELHNDAANAAELRIVDLRARLEQMRRIDTARLAELAEAMAMRGTITRVEALCHMQHEDSAVSIGDIRAALKAR